MGMVWNGGQRVPILEQRTMDQNDPCWAVLGWMLASCSRLLILGGPSQLSRDGRCVPNERQKQSEVDLHCLPGLVGLSTDDYCSGHLFLTEPFYIVT